MMGRSRMVLAYFLAQLLPSMRGRAAGSFLLVLGAVNADETMVGGFAKYDASSADINPIGSFSKSNVERLTHWALEQMQLPNMRAQWLDVHTGAPDPRDAEAKRRLEAEMGLTFDELRYFTLVRE
jgi:NAD+ synthase (glutamine-hydrolysing)